MALSYVWGLPNKPRVVYSNLGQSPITESPYSALKRLRNHGLPRMIWIDALCINQGDLSQRDQQVRLMAEIYVRASRVVIWLEDLEEVVGDGKTGLDDEVVVGQGDKPEVAGEED